MALPRIHLIAPAGSCRPFMTALGVGGADALVERFQQIVGDDFEITGDRALIEAVEDEQRGGRRDDQRRAEDIERALADDSVAAIVGLRGGAWLSRILPHIDFSVLQRRRRPVHVFGFSELTTLVNIVGGYRLGNGIYSLTPGFFAYGIKRRAALSASSAGSGPAASGESGREQIEPEVRSFLRTVASVVRGNAEPFAIDARLVSGHRPDAKTAAFVGGNLTVLSTLIGSRFADVVNVRGRWLVLEDFNDKPERFDRFLAHLTLAGIWDTCEGLLLGDFHHQDRELTDAVLAMLPYHVPAARRLPVLVTAQIGHVWPAVPLLLHRPIALRSGDGDAYTLTWDAANHA